MNKKEFISKIKKKYSTSNLMEYIEKLKNLNVLVIGETIIDEYQYGYTLGKSGKSPVIAFQNELKETYEGGILAIYNHLKDFVNVDIITSDFKIIKKRYLEGSQKLFETYTLGDNDIVSTETPIGEYDIVIIADYGHGLLNRNFRDKLIKESKYITLNTQINAGNRGINTINKYNGSANYISLSENELRTAFSDQFDSLYEILNERFDKKDKISITRAGRGCMIFYKGKIKEFPSVQKEIVDTVGAGDAFFCITSLLSYIDAPHDVVGFLGNVAGAYACTYSGNKEYINKRKILKFIEELYGR